MKSSILYNIRGPHNQFKAIRAKTDFPKKQQFLFRLTT
jgi:hypothetical protein